VACGCKKGQVQSSQQQANRQAARLKAREERQQAALKFKQEQAERYQAQQRKPVNG
jgi:hypothetical protein